MHLLTNAPPRVFTTKDQAEAAAAQMAQGEDEGWTYRVIPDPKGSGRCIIKVYDKDGEFVSNWTA
jgi:hypothetical protein